jgi:hypothetical protein
MRAAITEFSNCCQRLGQDEFVALGLDKTKMMNQTSKIRTQRRRGHGEENAK